MAVNVTFTVIFRSARASECKNVYVHSVIFAVGGTEKWFARSIGAGVIYQRDAVAFYLW